MKQIQQPAASPTISQPLSLRLKAICFACIALVVCTLSTESGAKHAKEGNVSFKREETIILNLERAPKAPKHIILTALRTTKATQKELDRAIRQVENADEAFAKARGKRDSRTMSTTVHRLAAALKTAQQLEQELNAANAELRADVQQTLISQ
jgi:hypothetical protein